MAVDGEITTVADLWLTDGRAVVEVVMMNIPDEAESPASAK